MAINPSAFAVPTANVIAFVADPGKVRVGTVMIILSKTNNTKNKAIPCVKSFQNPSLTSNQRKVVITLLRKPAVKRSRIELINSTIMKLKPTKTVSSRLHAAVLIRNNIVKANP